jgi:hypothetical protein
VFAFLLRAGRGLGSGLAKEFVATTWVEAKLCCCSAR